MNPLTITENIEELRQVDEWVARYRGEVDLADLLCDRHAGGPPQVAVRHDPGDGHIAELTFAELRDRSARFAGALARLGIGRGDRVATLLPKSVELVVATVGIWRLGAVHVPLFTAFGPEAAGYRIAHSGARAAVTDTANLPKLIDTTIPLVVVGGAAGVREQLSYMAALDADPVASSARLDGDGLFILLYTSGTTGQPKGVEYPVKLLAEIEQYLRFGLSVRDQDVYWNMADPGWAYGLLYALVGPLLLGQTVLFYGGPPEPAAIVGMVQRHGVTNLAGAPTLYRVLRAAGIPADTARLRLRSVSSAGEPLNPELIGWARAHLGVPIHDHYGQSELGMVAVNHHYPSLARPLRPGSMGPATPGFRVVVLTEAGREAAAGQPGEIAVDVGESPLFWFRGYYQDPVRTAERFTPDGRYYRTGDTGVQDTDGYFHFISRADDIITSAGYRIGPFEVESSLLGHAAVADAAVIGVPDALKGEVVKAFVVLAADVSGSEALARELREYVKTRLSAHEYPRVVEFVEMLPRTPSGKIQRYLLRDR